MRGLTALGEWSWRAVPVAAARVSRTAGAILADGSYLLAWPAPSGIVALLALLVGLSIGITHPIPGAIYTSAPPLVGLMIVVGAIAGGLGFRLWLGLVIGDILRPNPTPSYFSTLPSGPLAYLDEFARSRGSAMIVYLVLGLAVAAGPVICQQLRHQLFPWGARLRRQGPETAWLVTVIEAMMQGGLQAALVWAWLQSVPLLVRPVFIWTNHFESPSDIVPLTQASGAVIAAAGMAGAFRIVLVQVAASRPGVAARLGSLQSALRTASRRSMPLALRVILQAGLTTYLLSGLVETAVQGLAVFAVLAAARCLRLAMGRWLGAAAEMLTRIPVVLRLAVGGIVGYFLAAAALNAQQATRPSLLPGGPLDSTLAGDDFRPALVALLVAATFVSILLPDRSLARSSTRKVGAAVTGLALAGVMATMTAATPHPSYADNCGGLSDCWVTLAVAALAIAALAVIILLLAVMLAPELVLLIVAGADETAGEGAAVVVTEESAEAGAEAGSEGAAAGGAEGSAEAGADAGAETESSADAEAQAEAQRLNDLARDPAQGGKVTEKTLQEARIGLDLEKSGKLPGPVERDPTGAAEFKDAIGRDWDVKGFNSRFPPEKGGYELQDSLGKIDESLRLNENVIIDTSKMSQQAVDELRAALEARPD